MSTIPLTTTPSSALTAASEFTIVGQTATPAKHGKGGLLKSKGGKPSKKNMAFESGPGKLVHINGGKGVWTTGVNRRFVHFTVPVDGVSSISKLKGTDALGVKVEDKLQIKYPKDIKTTTIDLHMFSSPIDFELFLCSFNEASESPEKLRLEW